MVFGADGRPEKILTTVKVPLCHENGQVYALCGISIDVTAYKRLEMEFEAHRQHLEKLVEACTREFAERSEQLRLSEERYAYALDAASDGLWDWDMQSGGSHFNPAYFCSRPRRPPRRGPGSRATSWRVCGAGLLAGTGGLGGQGFRLHLQLLGVA